MSAYFFIRYGLISILLTGWILYQVFIKKKTWKQMQQDAMFCACFVAVWILIAWLMFD
jgi:hypothetical protein